MKLYKFCQIVLSLNMIVVCSNGKGKAETQLTTKGRCSVSWDYFHKKEGWKSYRMNCEQATKYMVQYPMWSFIRNLRVCASSKNGNFQYTQTSREPISADDAFSIVDATKTQAQK